MKNLLPAVVLVSLLTFPIPSIACSMAGCLDNGVEMRNDFVVRVTHADKPIAGVNVRVTRNLDGSEWFSGTTAANGTVRVTGLPAGEYWLTTELMGIGAGGECFHISSYPSRKAKQVVKYEWGDLAPSTRQIVGRLIDPAPGEGATFLQNIRNGVVEPIPEARLKLQNPRLVQCIAPCRTMMAVSICAASKWNLCSSC